MKTFNFNSADALRRDRMMNIHGLGAGGQHPLLDRSSFNNTHGGTAGRRTNTIFAATITGSGASTELTYLGSYLGLREDLIEWDNANGGPLGLAAVGGAAVSRASRPADSRSRAWSSRPARAPKPTWRSALRSSRPAKAPGPQPGPGDPGHELLLAVHRRQPGHHHTRPSALRSSGTWRGRSPLSIRQIRRNAEGEYRDRRQHGELVGHGLPALGLGRGTRRRTGAAERADPDWSPKACGTRSTRCRNRSPTATKSKSCRTTARRPGTAPAPKTPKRVCTTGLQKDLGRLFPVEIPAPGAPEPPNVVERGDPEQRRVHDQLEAGVDAARDGSRSSTRTPRGGWTHGRHGLSKREYTFKAGNPEAEGTWNYRVKREQRNRRKRLLGGIGTRSRSTATAPYTPTATAVARARLTPATAAGTRTASRCRSPPTATRCSPTAAPAAASNRRRLTAPETFKTSGSHEACGTVADNVGNVSAPGCLTVQVDATPPSLEISCPATALGRRSGRDGDRDRLRRPIRASPATRAGRFTIDTAQRGTPDDHTHGRSTTSASKRRSRAPPKSSTRHRARRR